MIFITLAKFRGKPKKETLAQADRLFKQMDKEGVKRLKHYWTLGTYDVVVILEATDEKSAMKALMRFGGTVSTETLIALPREEAVKLVE